MKFFTEDELRNYYKKVVEEGKYATEITVGEYSTPQEANAVLDTIRKQYGFGRYDSWVDGTSVKVFIERNPNDDSYFPDMINQMKNFGKQYRQVAESKKSKNMKKKITESQLRNIIAESVKKVLNESTLYGDTKPFEEIYRAATQIMDRYQYTQENGYESMDDDGGDVCGGVWQWAKKVAEDAEYYLQCHSIYQPINGGEDW